MLAADLDYTRLAVFGSVASTRGRGGEPELLIHQYGETNGELTRLTPRSLESLFEVAQAAISDDFEGG